MKKIMMILILMLLGGNSLYAGKGKVSIASNIEGAYIYVNDKKKAMTGEGFTSILLEEGDYIIKVIKEINENYYYIASKNVFVGEESSVKLIFKLQKKLVQQGKAKKIKKSEFTNRSTNDDLLSPVYSESNNW